MKIKLTSRQFLTALVAFTATMLAGCGKKDSDQSSDSSRSGKKRFAYVTNGVDPFWNTAAAGVRAAEKALDIECEVLMPPKGIVDQKRMMEGLIARGVDGIAISPIDARNQIDLINEAAARCPVITHDSDAPDSKRLCFVGMDNYKAGRAAGKLVKGALPGGGKVMIFVGRLEQLNAQQRRQGVIDELLDRPMQAIGRMEVDPPSALLAGAKYTVLDTRTDNFDYARAKANAQDAMASVPDLACMVGLFAYNAPLCLEAAKEAGRVDKIKIVSFDEQDAVLQAIIDGHIYGTISQQPYYYGFESMRILKGLASGDKSVLPPNDFLEIPIIEVTKANVEKFWVGLKRMQAAGK
jgi:ribose transport system substrate-binding protein